MATLQRTQLNRLCSTPETLDKAESILRLANAKTRPGSGFAVKNTVAIPAVCAYLASEQLNTGEVSLQSAMAAACVSKVDFHDTLKKVRAALDAESGNDAATELTYATLVDVYHVPSSEHATACMEDAEAALPQVDLLRERYGTNVVVCAVFYWVCQLIEEPSVQERTLRRAYSIDIKAFKAVVATLENRCDVVAEQIKSHFKPSAKGAARQTMTSKTATPMTSPSKKRVDHTAFLETPTKKRRVDYVSPTKAKTSTSLAKRPSSDATAAFHAALKGSPAKLQTVQPLVAGPSTPHRSQRIKVAQDPVSEVQADSQWSPSRSQGHVPPTRPSVRRRFRPVFLEQQQWCAQDPKVERMWAVAMTVRNKMVELHRHPFEGLGVR